eukprot:6138040-Amphidinium_carterae.7
MASVEKSKTNNAVAQWVCLCEKWGGERYMCAALLKLRCESVPNTLPEATPMTIMGHWLIQPGACM